MRTLFVSVRRNLSRIKVNVESDGKVVRKLQDVGRVHRRVRLP